MSPRRRALRAYRDLDVPLYVVSTALAIWLLVGTALALHLGPFDLPSEYHLLLEWAAGGFAGTVFYVVFACD